MVKVEGQHCVKGYMCFTKDVNQFTVSMIYEKKILVKHRAEQPFDLEQLESLAPSTKYN